MPDMFFTDGFGGNSNFSKRAITAVDIPNLDASKITSGGFGVSVVAASVDANGLGVMLVLKKAFTTLAVNTDLVIYNANAPFAFTVLDAFVQTTTGQTSAVMTLRDATGGAGNAITSAMTAAAAGKTRDAATTAPSSVAANGTLIARRTGGTGNITGTVVVMIQRN